ncbi:protein-glutamine gamma-glutamyltransferase E-like isoform 2-T2 [Anomaloglossus baeobatrachus]|uniref:protein-glutamine gamma-glutamyltransferase E-like isoform X2 n=1 Tax=Anomaloglossus baeobatrachus TaxID=238106 RepID=UPI003F4FA11B
MGGWSSTIHLESTNLHKKTNAFAHRTSNYISEELIVRRGEPFSMDLTFNRPPQSSDNLKITISSASINIELPVTIPNPSNAVPWSASSTLKVNTLTVTINSPLNAVIGCYTMALSFSNGRSTSSASLGKLYMLFNPWAKGDAVYMENEAEKKEYVLNETGIIFFGSASTIRTRPWDFAQFQEKILDITLKILDHSTEHRRDAKKDMKLRNDPSYVGRMLSGMINSQDDNGVLEGNWSSDYSGGVRPTKWNGSKDILTQWADNGSVRYGQCWVFAGVLCTVLRCLGIPARVVTNYSSAHDTDENLVIDRYFDEDGVESDETSDSIWNFHVWVEACFARFDIGPPYDGWQVLDATPQEPSEGLYRLGPCSVNAIKEGDVDLPYDAPFVYAEMNADVIDWVLSSDGTKKKIKSNTRTVGKFTSTKAINSDERVDITNNYKYAEGTSKERESFKKAQSKLSGSGLRRGTIPFAASSTEAAPTLNFSGNFTSSSDIEIGQDVTFSLNLKNTSTNEMSLQVNLTASAIVYTNATVSDLLTNAQSVKLGPNEETSIPYNVPYAEYGNVITPDKMIKAVSMCEDEKGRKLLVETVILLKDPTIMMKILDQAHLNKPLSVEIAFTNPTAEEVHNCVLIVEGSGLVKDKIIIEEPLLSKNQRSVSKVDIVPYQPGKRCLFVDFSCDSVSDVKGSLTIDVAPN